MVLLSEEMKRELLQSAASESLGQDLRHLRVNRHNPLIRDGRVEINRVLEFLSSFNEMTNHQPKPFKKINDRNMKL